MDVVIGATGPTSDIALFRQQQLRFSPQQQFVGDKAYLGEEAITIPHKKPPQAQLTDEQRAANRILSSRRIFIEHLIRFVKVFRVAKEQFRLHRDSYECVILSVCGLVRLRIGALVLPQFPQS